MCQNVSLANYQLNIFGISHLLNVQAPFQCTIDDEQERNRIILWKVDRFLGALAETTFESRSEELESVTKEDFGKDEQFSFGADVDFDDWEGCRRSRFEVSVTKLISTLWGLKENLLADRPLGPLSLRTSTHSECFDAVP